MWPAAVCCVLHTQMLSWGALRRCSKAVLAAELHAAATLSVSSAANHPPAVSKAPHCCLQPCCRVSPSAAAAPAN